MKPNTSIMFGWVTLAISQPTTELSLRQSYIHRSQKQLNPKEARDLGSVTATLLTSAQITFSQIYANYLG